MSKLAFLALPVAVALAAVPSTTQALSVSPSGSGNVLILPYYTVNGGLSTLIEVSGNYTVTVLRVRVHESRNGREVSAFNVFVPAYGTWTGVVFNPGATLPAGLLPDQTMCTAPSVANVGMALPDGRRYIPFSKNDYTGARTDGGGDDVQRTREGWIEIYATAQVKYDASPGSAYNDFVPASGPPRCDAAVGALGAAGNGLLEGAGASLVGRVQIVDALAGTLQGYTGTAITGFIMPSLYDASGLGPPTLADAQPDTFTHQVVATTVERVRDDDGRTHLQERRVGFPPERAIDAVSTVLMQSCLQQDFVATAEAGAATDWVLTFPTKAYYTDPARIGGGAARSPFSEAFVAHEGQVDACERTLPDLYSRSGAEYPACEFEGLCIVGVPPPTRAIAPKTCHASSVIAFSPDAISHVLKSAAPDSVNLSHAPFREGQAQMHFDGSIAQGDAVIHGLPVIGFAAVGYVNGNVTPGVLSNYTAAAPLRDCSVRQN